jgi:hypothetical protein
MFLGISPLLRSTVSLSLLLGLTRAVAQTSPASSAAVEVAYITSNGAVETWNVDPQTGLPTDQGQTLVPPVYFSLVPSADDHFVYITGTDPASNTEKLWVYATGANGVLQVKPIQKLSLPNGTSNLTIAPSGTFAYAVHAQLNSQNYEVSAILLFHVNPTTGTLFGRTVVTKYPPGGLCNSQLDDGYPSLIGFNSKGTQLYDSWYCSFHESGSVNYYALQVNPSTGSLSAGTEIFSWGISTGGGFDTVDFTPKNLIDFQVPNDYQIGINSVNVYPPNGGTTPTFSCDASMLEACGYGLNMHVDPSGKFIFLETSTDNTQETKLNLTAKQIVSTPYYLPDTLQAFSPDDTLIYAQSPNNGNPPFIYPVYTFDSVTGALGTTNGAQIYTQQPFSTLVPALRK